jgi:hypothetical protein
MARTQHQKFEYRVVHRSQLNAAPYNPNVMSDYSYRLLQAKLKSVGLITTLVWNESTGHLVGGHHRLKAIDQLEGKLDYQLGVAVVNLPLAREKEMCLFLNNARVQGHFDKDLFFKMLEEQPLDLNDIGMTRLDLEMEFGELPGIYRLGESLLQKADLDLAVVAAEALDIRAAKVAEAKPAVAPAPVAPAPVAPPAKQYKPGEIEKMRQAKRDYKEQRSNAPENDMSYYLVLRFDRTAEKEAFLRSRQFPIDLEYVTAAQLGLVGKKEVTTAA